MTHGLSACIIKDKQNTSKLQAHEKVVNWNKIIFQKVKKIRTFAAASCVHQTQYFLFY